MKSEKMSFKKQPGRILFLSGLVFLFLSGLLFACLPAERIITFLNPLSPDGEFESLTISLVHRLQPLAITMSLILVVVFLVFLYKKPLYAQVITWIQQQTKGLIRDARQTVSIMYKHMHNPELWLDVLLLLGIASILRFMSLQCPLEHDEAYTYYVFGRLPFRYAIADYSIPNNHVFHTLLMKISVAIFGSQTWAIRLPAFLFGSAAAPLIYLFSRYTTHKRNTSLLAGGLIALYPYMVFYSTNARGYSMVAFFSILGALLVYDMMQHKNRFLWVCFSIVIIAGLWTMPVMMLPAGGLYTWILWLGLRGQHDPAYGKWGWLKHTVVSGILIVLGTLLVYLPVILYSGMDSLIANPYVSALSSADFLPTLSDRLKDTWSEWQIGYPLSITLPLVGIMIFGFFHPDKKVRQTSTIIPAFFTFLIIYSIVQKPNLWPRVTYYLVSFLMLALAFGFSAIWQWLRLPLKNQPFIFGGILVLAVISLIHSPNYSPLKNHIVGETEQQAQWLAQNWNEDQLILIAYPEDMAFSVYMEQNNIPPAAIRWETPFRGAYIIINKPEKHNMEWVIQNHGPELSFFDLTSAQLITDYANSAMYYVPSNWVMVEEAYQ
jgi:4-amino-4-deoxy-L-arabinose transferase-like glycosyltransferase